MEAVNEGGQNTPEEGKKPVQYIKNPLPGPKPHVKKEMGYDYEVPPEKMNFDIENPERNYYDV
jgi:hypothetical protein